MKVSTRSRYGVRAMLELGLNFPGGPMPLRTLASRQEISAKYLEQLLIPLKSAGMVRSQRGARGGYMLAVDPEEVTLLMVVRALEGPMSLVDCVEDPEYCGRMESCAAHRLWTDLNRLMEDYLAGQTLAQLMAEQKELSKTA